MEHFDLEACLMHWFLYALILNKLLASLTIAGNRTKWCKLLWIEYSICLFGRIILTVPIVKRRVERNRNLPPYTHVTWVIRFDVVISLIQFPVHVTTDDVGSVVKAPDKGGVYLLNVSRESQLCQRHAVSRVTGNRVITAVCPELVPYQSQKSTC